MSSGFSLPPSSLSCWGHRPVPASTCSSFGGGGAGAEPLCREAARRARGGRRARRWASASAVWGCGTSREARLELSLREAVAGAARPFRESGAAATLALVFVRSRAEEGRAEEEGLRRVVPIVRKHMALQRVLAQDAVFFGCTAGPLAGEESDPSATVALARLPGTAVVPFAVGRGRQMDLDWRQEEWRRLVGLDGRTDVEDPVFVLLQHPDYEHGADLLAGLDFSYPRSLKVGAVAGAVSPLHRVGLIGADGTVLSNGVIGLALAPRDGEVDFEAIVAQGARGVGPRLEVVEVNGQNEIARVREMSTPTVAEAAPMQLFEMWGETGQLSTEDKALASQYLLVGVLVEAAGGGGGGGADGAEGEVGRTVVRRVVGFNTATRSLAVDGPVRVGQAIRFQVRDEAAARAELDVLLRRAALETAAKAPDGLRPLAALLLADSERGPHLFGPLRPAADRDAFRLRFGAAVPLAALGCAGQLCPLPTPGYQAFFPIDGVRLGGSTFRHSGSAVYLIVYAKR